MFVSKHSGYDIHKLHGEITPEFLGLGIHNFGGYCFYMNTNI